METKRTEVKKHYWNNEGVYDKEFTEMTERLMKPSGRGDNLTAEVVRAANRLYYEYCNNGNCNAIDVYLADPNEVVCPNCGGRGYLGDDDDEDDEDNVCDECGGAGVIYEGSDEEEISVSEYYDNFIKLIKKSVENNDIIKVMDDIRNFMLDGTRSPHDIYFNDNNMHNYDLMIDLVYEWAVEHENDNVPIPTWYRNN